jgi:PAS domain-containing protein
MVSGVVAEVADAAIVTDPDLRVLSWNPAAEKPLRPQARSLRRR